MITPFGKRAVAWAVFIAVAHSAAWAGFVYQIKALDFRSLEQRQAVIRWLDWTKTGPGMQPDKRFNLYLRLQLLTPLNAAPQLVVHSTPRPKMRAYFEQHRSGSVVDVWVDRRNGSIQKIFPPEAPDFFRLLYVLLPILGAITFLIALLTISEVAYRRRSRTES